MQLNHAIIPSSTTAGRRPTTFETPYFIKELSRHTLACRIPKIWSVLPWDIRPLGLTPGDVQRVCQKNASGFLPGSNFSVDCELTGEVSAKRNGCFLVCSQKSRNQMWAKKLDLTLKSMNSLIGKNNEAPFCFRLNLIFRFTGIEATRQQNLKLIVRTMLSNVSTRAFRPCNLDSPFH